MLSLKKWAVLGASDKHDRYGYKIFKKLLNEAYEVYPVNPGLDQIEGIKVYPSLKDVPVQIEVVDFVINPSTGKAILKEVKDLGIKNIWLQPGTRSEEIDQLAAEYDLNVVKDCVLISLR